MPWPEVRFGPVKHRPLAEMAYADRWSSAWPGCLPYLWMSGETRMNIKGSEIRVNRAPVLTLWAAIVGERLGHDADAGITHGRAVAGSSARVKARAIGLEEHGRSEPRSTVKSSQPLAPRQTVHLLGRDVPVVEQRGSQHALDHDKPASPGPAHAYVERAFGERLAEVRCAMETLADSMAPDELNRVGFRLYEQFRSEVPGGANGWGAKGMLDLDRIQGAAG